MRKQLRTLDQARILICLTYLLGTPLSAKGQQAELPIDLALSARSFPSLMPIELSLDGQWVAYTVQNERQAHAGAGLGPYTRNGVPSSAVGCDIWVTNTESGETLNLTNGVGTSWGPAWSSDSDRLAFYSDRTGEPNLWMWERSTGEFRHLSDAVMRPFLPFDVPVWSPDGKKILTKILSEAHDADGIAKIFGGIPTESNTKGGEGTSTVTVYRSTVVRQQEGSVRTQDVGPGYADLALIEIVSGKLERIARGFQPEWYAFSPEGTAVAFVSRKGRAEGSLAALFDLKTVLLPTGILRDVAQDIHFGLPTSVSWSPNGKFLSYIENGIPGEGNCFVVSFPDGRLRRATATDHPAFNDGRPHYFSLRPPIWDAHSNAIYTLAGNALWKISLSSGKAMEIARVPNPRIPIEVVGARRGTFWSPNAGRSLLLVTRNENTRQYGVGKIDLTTGAYVQVLEENKTYAEEVPLYAFDVSGDGAKVAYLSEDFQHPPDIWIAGSEFKNPRRLTRTNLQFDSYQMGEGRLIEWQTVNGTRVRGALVLPSHYEISKKYPLILWSYPGDTLSVGINLFGGHRLGISGIENVQVLATRGYAVLLPDSGAEVGPDYVKSFVQAVMPGVDRVVELGIADPERIGLIGHSNGGYGVLALITHTNRFKAAVSRGGFADLFSLYGEMARDGSSLWTGEVEQGRMGGTPWQYRDRYIENSPLFYFDRVQTPLLIVHGSLDEAVNSAIADQTFVSLRRLGKDVVYARYEGEGHWEGRWSYANQIDYWERIINWFDEHLRAGNSENARRALKCVFFSLNR